MRFYAGINQAAGAQGVGFDAAPMACGAPRPDQAAAQAWAWRADEEPQRLLRTTISRTERIALAPGAARPGTLLWFIPDFNIGSGGHQTIFRTIWHLERMGWESNIVIVSPTEHATAELARHDICTHFFALQSKVFIGFDNLPNSEFVVATGWQTA